jgi:hypothetical protein
VEASPSSQSRGNAPGSNNNRYVSLEDTEEAAEETHENMISDTKLPTLDPEQPQSGKKSTKGATPGKALTLDMGTSSKTGIHVILVEDSQEEIDKETNQDKIPSNNKESMAKVWSK